MGWRDTVHRIQEPSWGKCGATTDLFLASLMNEYRFLNEMFNVARLSAAKTATIDFAAKARWRRTYTGIRLHQLRRGGDQRLGIGVTR